jgi:hypothetical protein
MQKIIITLVFQKDAIFFHENWGKSLKIGVFDSKYC